VTNAPPCGLSIGLAVTNDVSPTRGIKIPWFVADTSNCAAGVVVPIPTWL
jgi:hypothetical protein